MHCLLQINLYLILFSNNEPDSDSTWKIISSVAVNAYRYRIPLFFPMSMKLPILQENNNKDSRRYAVIFPNTFILLKYRSIIGFFSIINTNRD